MEKVPGKSSLPPNTLELQALRSPPRRIFYWTRFQGERLRGGQLNGIGQEMKQGHRKQPVKDITAILDNVHAELQQAVSQHAGI